MKSGAILGRSTDSPVSGVRLSPAPERPAHRRKFSSASITCSAISNARATRSTGSARARCWSCTPTRLWTSSALGSQDAQDLQREGIDSVAAQWNALKSYSARNVGRVALGIAVFFALVGGFYWGRGRARRLFDEAHSAVLRTSVLERPVAAALLLSLLGSRWIYDQAPRLLWVGLSALALVPSVVIVERLITPALRTLP